jgi:chromosome segregation ATPase
MAALRRGGVASFGRDTTSAAAIAAAAAGDDGAGDGGLGPSPAPSVSALSEQHEEDVANLVRHAETLEGVCEKLRGNLAASEKRVDALREQVMLERRKFRNLLARIEHRGGEDEAAAAAAVEASEAELAALRRALEEQKEETERVRAKCKDQMEEMEHEVELYVEMVDEMKRELGAR